LLLEVTALVGAGVDAKEIEAKVTRALRMADEGVAWETVGEIVRRPDGAATDDLLRQAARRLSAWDPSLQADDAEAMLIAGAHLLAEAEPALARFRELGRVHELLTEGATMIEAGFDAKQIDANVERALTWSVCSARREHLSPEWNIFEEGLATFSCSTPVSSRTSYAPRRRRVSETMFNG
jgi:hypothetical protein